MGKVSAPCVAAASKEKIDTAGKEFFSVDQIISIVPQTY